MAGRRLAMTLASPSDASDQLLDSDERMDALTRSLSLDSIDLHSWDMNWHGAGRDALHSSILTEAAPRKPGTRRKAFDRRQSIRIKVQQKLGKLPGHDLPPLREDFALELREIRENRDMDKGKERNSLSVNSTGETVTKLAVSVNISPAASVAHSVPPALDQSTSSGNLTASSKTAHASATDSLSNSLSPRIPTSPSPRRLSGSGIPAQPHAVSAKFSDPSHQAAHEALLVRLKALNEVGVETDKGALRAGRLTYIVCVLGMWLEYACYRSEPAPSAAEVSRQMQNFLWTYEKACSPSELLAQLISFWRQPPAFWTAANTLIQEKETRPDRIADIVMLRQRAQIIFLSRWLCADGTYPHQRGFLSQANFVAQLRGFLQEANSYYEHRGAEYALEKRLLLAVVQFIHAPPTGVPAPTWVAAEMQPIKKSLLGSGSLALGSARLVESYLTCAGVPKGGFEFMDLSDSELADQLTLINHADWCALDLSDLLYCRYEKRPDTAIRTIDVRAQGVLHWLLTEILTCAHLAKRAAVVSAFSKIVAVAKALKKRGNMQGMYVFTCALTQGPILRLDKTFAAISGSTRKKQQQLLQLVHKPPYKEYRVLLHKREAEKRAYVPVLQVMKDDLLRLNELPMFLDERDFDTKNFINFAGRVMSLGGYKEALEHSRHSEWYAYDATNETPRARALRAFLRNLQPRGKDDDFYRMAKQIEPKTTAA